MRLTVRLILILALAAVVPLAATGVILVDLGREALERQVHAGQRTAAERVAEGADLWLGQTLGRLRLSTDLFDLARLDEASRIGALRLVYRQIQEVDIVALYDQQGHEVVPPVRLEDAQVQDERLPVNDAELEAFRQRVPLAAALEQGLAVGEPYLAERKHTVMVPVGVRASGSGSGWVLAAEVSLRPLQALVARVPADDVGVAYLVDRAGRVLAHPDGARFLEPARAPREVLGSPDRIYRFQADGIELLATSATLDPQAVPWAAVVEQREDLALRAVRSMVQRTGWVLGFALIVAIGIGALLSRGIAGPIRRVSAGARAIAAGDLEQRIPEAGGVEEKDLARAFNSMATEVARSREEIEGFNRDLQQRVTERTAELKKAQAELLQSRKLTAIGELGAGVAHELNNPLTGILGMAQLLKRKHKDDEDPERKYLLRIEEDAKRCREITMNLLRFSEQGEKPVLAETDLNRIVRAAVDLHAGHLAQQGLEVEQDLAADLPQIKADPAQLQQVLMNLLSNASHATDPGGRIRLETGIDGAFTYVRVSDTGRGIPPENLDRIFEPFFTTKEDWRGAGLGLSVAYQIVQAHHGALDVASRPGEGTTFTVSVPLPVKVGAAPAAVGT